jgi:hypothetical protein
VNTANGGGYARYVLGTIFRGFLLRVGLGVALGARGWLQSSTSDSTKSLAEFSVVRPMRSNANHGKFVDQYSTYIAGSIDPGESRNFKIACGCNAPPAEHDSYKLEAIP